MYLIKSKTRTRRTAGGVVDVAPGDRLTLPLNGVRVFSKEEVLHTVIREYWIMDIVPIEYTMVDRNFVPASDYTGIPVKLDPTLKYVKDMYVKKFVVNSVISVFDFMASMESYDKIMLNRMVYDDVVFPKQVNCLHVFDCEFISITPPELVFETLCCDGSMDPSGVEVWGKLIHHGKVHNLS